MHKQLFLLVLLLSMATTLTALPDSPERSSVQPMHQSKPDSLVIRQTVGVAIDLLPPVMSAISGNFGYSAQLWVGYKKFRVRGVIAGFTMPDKLMGNEDFTTLETTATALIFDYFLKTNFKGWWWGAGIENWNNTITRKTNNLDYHFRDVVATAGSGYIFKVYRNFTWSPGAPCIVC